MYAAREYKVDEPITVYMGIVMGPADDPSTQAWLAQAISLGIGRHVMKVGGMLVDGEHGASGAQYINSDYHLMHNGRKVPTAWTTGQQDKADRGWWARGVWVTDTHNNAQFKTTGIIRATAVIHEGREILMAYGADYWRGMRNRT